jgi:sugar/nucleoside kinase (ribokinase family)
MKILLIGHSIVDNVENNIYPGGVYYSLLGFLSNFKPNDEIYLLTSWNKKYLFLFEKLYSLANLKFSEVVEQMPEVILFTSGDEERREIYKNISSNLPLNKIENIKSFDGILINMITGFDLSLEQMKLLRENYSGKIYFDVHTLSRGIDENMKREFRPIPKIDEWLNCIDILQCNVNELRTIYNGSEEESAKFVLNLGVKIILITKAEKGSVAYFMKENKLQKIEAQPFKVDSKNKIGCGDIFGATFFYHFLQTNDLQLSIQKANKAGAIAASIQNLSTLKRLPL